MANSGALLFLAVVLVSLHVDVAVLETKKNGRDGRPPRKNDTKAELASANDVCTTRTPFDAAVTTADGNTYFFRGEQFWKLKKMGEMADPPEGESIQAKWEHPGSIDAAFTYKTKTYLFKGQEVWTYNNRVREGSPAAISDTWDDTPKKLTKIDAAIGHENGVYFFQGKNHFEWKEGPSHLSDQKKNKQLMTEAKDFSGDVSAAFQLDGAFYLLNKGRKYWKAEMGSDGKLTIAKDKEYPQDVFVDFFGCEPTSSGPGGKSLGSAATSALASAATTVLLAVLHYAV